jgi:RimJ/RimL family protein N-acetyltransferase
MQRSGKVVGMSRLSEVDFGHRRCELGFSWYDPSLFRSGVNLESKLLLLRLAFDTLALHRVQIHTDTRNLRSQRAIEALGARQEGVLRRHQVAADGYVRDTVVYSITDLDWPLVSERLTDKLAAKLSSAVT